MYKNVEIDFIIEKFIKEHPVDSWIDLCELWVAEHPRSKILWDNMLHTESSENLMKLVMSECMLNYTPEQEMRVTACLTR